MPDVAWLGALRHGESMGNVAANQAEATGADTIAIDTPDHATGLTQDGRDQASTVGTWFRHRPVHERPEQVVSSPYLRAQQTAEPISAALDVDLVVDERLRDRELGILDRLTRRGVLSRYPEEAARRAYLGRFYHRPPGGESWADVAARLRAFLDQYRAAEGGRRVLLVTHEAVINLCRYVLEGLTVEEVETLALRPLANAGLTSWQQHGGRLALVAYDDTTAAQATETRQPHV